MIIATLGGSVHIALRAFIVDLTLFRFAAVALDADDRGAVTLPDLSFGVLPRFVISVVRFCFRLRDFVPAAM
jgi:hypothetical protein